MKVKDTHDPYVKLVSRYDGDPTPDEVWLDEDGRYLRITNYAKVETFTYDDDGYLVEQTLAENAGQGWVYI